MHTPDTSSEAEVPPLPPKASPPTVSQGMVKVKFEYKAQGEKELSLSTGQIIKYVYELCLFSSRIPYPAALYVAISMRVSSHPHIWSVPLVGLRLVTSSFFLALQPDFVVVMGGERRGRLFSHWPCHRVLDKEGKTWWRGELQGKVGMFPAAFVELV